MNPSSFVEHVLDLLEPLGAVRARAMMGGTMVFCGALPVALLFDDRLYLKTDEATRGSFEAAGGEAFTYELRGRVVEMSYWSPPDGALEDREAMSPWAELAFAAARRARRAPRRTQRKRAAGKRPRTRRA